MATTTATARSIRAFCRIYAAGHGRAPSQLVINHSRQLSSSASKSSVEHAKEMLRTAKAVCFDVGSTITPWEGIDELAIYKGVGDKVAQLTTKAMGGNLPFKDALTSRLNLIRPSESDLVDLLKQNPPKLVPGIDKFINRLHSRGVAVYLLTGGFRQLTNPLADQLRIPTHRVYANNLIFDSRGQYLGFDSTEFTCKDGGKPAAINDIKLVHGFSPIVMIGDGVTDMQAKPPADAFIGFGGVVEREAVKNGADWFVTSYEELISAL